MMKTLFLIRHAKSSWTDDSLSDIDRPLNKRGRRQVSELADHYLAQGAFDGTVHVSHACRARQTIEGMLEQLTDPRLVTRVHFDPALYTFRDKQLLRWLRKADDATDTLTIVGHNPALSDLLTTLVGHEVCDMTTAALVKLQLPVQRWQDIRKGQARVTQVLSPADTSYRLFRRKAPKAPENGDTLVQQVPASLTYQLRCIQALQPGVAQAMDPEFLHQFRINLRRSRAIIESIYGITGDDALLRAIKPMKRMARRTSRLRDLDVFLQDLQAWSADDNRLRQSLRASGAMDFFRQQQALARQHLLKHLEGPGWQRKQAQWEQFVTGKPLRRILRRVQPRAINEKIGHRCQDCLALYRALTPESPDTAFHDVRKALKRLRYLAELDAAGQQDLLTELKGQQNLYGYFQDRHVQLELLSELAASRQDGRLPPALAALAERLDSDRLAARRDILERPPALIRP